MAASTHVSISYSIIWGATVVSEDENALLLCSYECLQVGTYGQLRTYASLAWITFAPLAGWVNHTYGLRMGIAVYFFGSLLAVPAAWMLPTQALHKERVC